MLSQFDIPSIHLINVFIEKKCVIKSAILSRDLFSSFNTFHMFSHYSSRTYGISTISLSLSLTFTIKYDHPSLSSVCLIHITRSVSTINENEARTHLTYYENHWQAINSDKIRFYEAWFIDKSQKCEILASIVMEKKLRFSFARCF